MSIVNTPSHVFNFHIGMKIDIFFYFTGNENGYLLFTIYWHDDIIYAIMKQYFYKNGGSHIIVYIYILVSILFWEKQ